MSRELIVDGSMGEGGGQILRTSLALAAVLGKPIKIINIRAKRKNPGLQRQHIISVKAVAALSSARVEGLRLGSTTLRFEPKRLRGGRFEFDIGTAGSVTLVLQAVLPAAIFAPEPIEMIIRGGTDVPWSPPVDYVRFVLRRLLLKFGIDFELYVKRRGHYPRGGGIVIFKLPKPPRYLESIKLIERGNIKRIEGLSHCVRLPSHVAERQANAAKNAIINAHRGVPVVIDIEYYEANRDPHLGPGSGIVVWALTENSVLGGDSIGAKGKRAEVVGEEAAKKLLEDLATGKALDRHASDMLIPFAALANGVSMLGGAKLTLHAATNIDVVRMLTKDVDIELIEGDMDKPFVLRVKGLGLSL